MFRCHWTVVMIFPFIWEIHFFLHFHFLHFIFFANIHRSTLRSRKVLGIKISCSFQSWITLFADGITKRVCSFWQLISAERYPCSVSRNLVPYWFSTLISFLLPTMLAYFFFWNSRMNIVKVGNHDCDEGDNLLHWNRTTLIDQEWRSIGDLYQSWRRFFLKIYACSVCHIRTSQWINEIRSIYTIFVRAKLD